MKIKESHVWIFLAGWTTAGACILVIAAMLGE